MIHEVFERLGRDASDSEAIAALVRDYEKGLPCEDEFRVLVGWLGGCRFVHGLAQELYPIAPIKQYTVPDLLATFMYDGKPVPVLVEVKSREGRVLVLSKAYARRLAAYSALLKLPLLIACKWRSYGLWTMTSIESFTQRPSGACSISFEVAAKDSLLGLLAGDFGVVLSQGLGFHLHYRIENRISPDEFDAVISQAYYTDGNGEHLNTLRAGVWQFFLSAPTDLRQEESDDILVHHFEVGSETMVFAQQLLPLFEMTKEDPTWKQLLDRGGPSLNCGKIMQDLKEGIGAGLVRYILHPHPPALPSFLSPPKGE